MNPRGRGWPLAAVAFVALAAHLSLYPRIADLDGFYHLGHARAYAAGSIFDTSLPWATQSAIRDHGADIWWGFHVVLLPFTAIDDVEWGVRLAALALTLVLSACVLFVLRRHGVPGAAWWTAAFLVAVPNVLFRHVMLRPHVLSVGLALLLLSVLARGSWRQALAVSAALTWLHLGLFWMAPGIVVAYALVRGVEAALRRAVPTPEADTPRASVGALAGIAAVLAGTALGWLLRPAPLEAAALAGVQIIRLFAAKATEEPLLFAAELYPVALRDFLGSAPLFLLAWLAAAAVTARSALRGSWGTLRPEERTLLAAAVLTSAVFLALTLLSARRAMVEWTAFGMLALPLAWAARGDRGSTTSPRTRRALVVVSGLALAAHLGWGAWRHSLNVSLVAFPPDRMAAPAAFLATNSEPGDIVFHARWDNFGPLFARNRTNHYLGGMDPIFQFAHDSARYWEYFYLSADVNVEWTCDAFPCASGRATDTHEVILDHFGARWVVVEPARNPRLSLYLLNDPRFALALETPREAVFEVLP